MDGPKKGFRHDPHHMPPNRDRARAKKGPDRQKGEETDRGKARIQGMGSTRCDPRILPAALLGVASKTVAFSGFRSGFAASGITLSGQGCEDASILYDVGESVPEESKIDEGRSSDTSRRVSRKIGNKQKSPDSDRGEPTGDQQ